MVVYNLYFFIMGKVLIKLYKAYLLTRINREK
jgi:hypothetical protein